MNNSPSQNQWQLYRYGLEIKKASNCIANNCILNTKLSVFLSTQRDTPKTIKKRSELDDALTYYQKDYYKSKSTPDSFLNCEEYKTVSLIFVNIYHDFISLYMNIVFYRIPV